MNNRSFKYPDQAAYDSVISYFNFKQVKLDDIAHITFNMQHKFIPKLGIADAKLAVIDVLHKREVLNNIMVGIAMDQLAARDDLPEPLLSIVKNDAGVFGVDETLALGVANIYGSIGVTNFGYLDRVKQGIIKELDTSSTKGVNTFLDDIVGAVASAAAAKLAHEYA